MVTSLSIRCYMPIGIINFSNLRLASVCIQSSLQVQKKKKENSSSYVHVLHKKGSLSNNDDDGYET